MPAINSKKKIALVGMGECGSYVKMASHGYEFEHIWDAYRLYKFCEPGSYCVYDINAKEIEAAKALGINAVACDVTKSPLLEKYDCIFASDVIEHVYDVYGFMNNLKASLADGGVLVLTTPNSVYFRNCITDNYYNFHEHLYTFNMMHFKNWATLLNMEIVELTTFQSISVRPKIKEKLKMPLYMIMNRLHRSNSIMCVFKIKRE